MEEIETYILKENVLTDDLLHIAPKGKVFKGGYYAIIEYFTYLNQWNDEKHIRRFRNNTNLQKYINKHYNK